MKIDLTDIYNDNITLPQFADRLKVALDIVKTIKSYSDYDEGIVYEAYIVGGFVRDLLMADLKPKARPAYSTLRNIALDMVNNRRDNVAFGDIDIATNMPITLLEKHFKCKSNHGEAHGTILVLQDGCTFEVTQFRTDGTYSDGRHPDTVTFAKTFQEDTDRRDFTINALGMDEDGLVYDYHNGIQDLISGVIRCVGDPNERFHEDALRMLRAIRFAAVLGFKVEKQTYEAIKNNACSISNVAMERVWAEFEKCFKTHNVTAIKNMIHDVDETNLGYNYDSHKYVDYKRAYELFCRYDKMYRKESEDHTRISESMATCMMFLPTSLYHGCKSLVEAAMHYYRTHSEDIKKVIWIGTMSMELGLEFKPENFDNTNKYPSETEGRHVSDILTVIDHRYGPMFIRAYPVIANDFNEMFMSMNSIVMMIHDQIPPRAVVARSVNRVLGHEKNFRKVMKDTIERLCRDAMGTRYLTDERLDKLVREVAKQ